ncbi:2-oxoglutarate dehydrogenase complex dihydrolipoyllysine-residue succinyltransferase [Paenibacillus sp. ACRRX]|uniref:2-oxoglutarate dehydrogenase complex dihydrolipoyllysine-residue succinyltransferase n=1 Tax=unclassified Paenibacillus TaxID=185978 RepID=UPI001EF4597A|nr:2-oxoglutarate dehydrogenase complex dihydrolipoyllysine-residue succinyltransferase [Paenibacillus sp. UMB4589-SE434]MCG7408805.1 2-oxoglutarate dehydrogenase complex dihydrolipoyllysine-residue succinyltransferase [Paenibacillus sp. ACRRX]MDK8183575.1 2-oxoglutarate dehydrogenase complex dihydrolipoyllysine-residue succinyltransferase [Paenibacillus sp. UMB4589-SE434]
MAEIKVPELGESITEGTLHKWHVKQGEAVKQGDVLAELETDKVNLEISAEEDGVLEQILRPDGENVQVGEVIGVIRAGGSASAPVEAAAAVAPQPTEASAPSAAVPAAVPTPVVPAADNSDTYATPHARKLAREQGIDLREVQTRDPLGRIKQEDVQAQARLNSVPASAVAAPRPAAVPQAASSASEAAAQAGKPVEVRKMSRRRQTIAKRLVEAQQSAAMLTTFNEVDMTAIMDVRKRRKDKFKEKHDVNLGFMSFFTKAVIGALKAYPLLNAEIAGDELLVKKYYDIGIAVSAKEGLVVPVVRDADRLGFADIEKQIIDLAGKARANTLAISDLQGGTFTITNGGVFGSLLSTPILNAPQVGILGMHKIQLRPVAIDQERMENRPMMYIALSYDHRIVDGAEAVSFLVKVKELLEDPESLLLEG